MRNRFESRPELASGRSAPTARACRSIWCSGGLADPKSPNEVSGASMLSRNEVDACRQLQPAYFVATSYSDFDTMIRVVPTGAASMRGAAVPTRVVAGERSGG